MSESAERVRECYMFGNGMSFLSLTELTGLDYFRGLANPDKEMDTGFQHRSHAYSPGIFKSHKKTVFNRTKTFTKPLS